MADTHPPFLNAYGNVTKVLDRIKDAKTPPRFTQDFLSTVLKCSGGGARPVIPLLKRLGFLSSDGTPTERYKKFRNSTHAGSVMAAGIRGAYEELFRRNEYVYQLPKNELKSLIVEATGLEPTSSVVKGILGTFEALNKYATWEAEEEQGGEEESEPEGSAAPAAAQQSNAHLAIPAAARSNIGVAFQINLVLPETDDPAVFQAIFKSLKEYILQ